MALIRMARMLVALLLVAVAEPAGGATVGSAPMAGPPAPVVAIAPPVAASVADAASAPVAATDDDEDNNPQTIPAEDLLASDGTLRPDGTFNGAVDISGWNVTLDPDNGPVFSPQALTYTWENLGTGVEGLLNGSVNAIAISGTDVYVGGRFTNAGGVTSANYLARWDGAQWHAVGGANAISASFPYVKAIAISGNNVFVGGAFTNAGGVPGADYIARWDGATWSGLLSGTLGISNTVNTIVLSGTDVYVGGTFTDAGGVTGADYIARWNSANNTRNLVGGPSAINGFVNAIAISGADVYVGGFFFNAGGVLGANNIARWDGATNTWNLVGGPGAITSFVNAIAISGTNVYVGGDFTGAGGVSGADYIARWNGATWSGLLSGTFGISNTVIAIAISGADVYVGGVFANAGGVTGAGGIARWNSASNTWNLVGAANAINAAVRDIKFSGSDVYIGGDFINAGGNNANDYLIRWTGSAFVPPGSETAGPLNGTVSAVVVSGTEVFVGGIFTNAGNVPGANYVAKWNGTTWSGLLSGTLGINGPFVSTIALSGTDVYVGGNFTDAGGVPGANSIARWNGSTWNAVGPTPSITGTVTTIAISGTEVFAGGIFFNAGGVTGADNIARWNGTTWSGLLSGTFGISGTVTTIALSGTNVYVGGAFTNAGGVTGANRIARWNSANSTWNRLGAANAINATVNTIAIIGTDVYVGGNFTDAGGVTGANHIARWNSASNTWNLVGAANAVNSTVRAIKVSGSDVYIGGDFTNAGGNSAADYLVRWDGTQWTALVSGTEGVFGPVRALAVPSSDDVYAGGNFLNTGNNPFADYIARYALATKRVYLPLIVR
ncbi:MAG: hypothetical protein K6T87_01380 [Roseiflexus sp.]|uniref:beta strand repeat-containing protein n=1 Tax=Roseiflexus sp. TaxID=2562120 RepID=UPI0025D83CE5|nr:hypothetical protein [Roseiflexus sp.]MCL6539238.1 hypothetical protein [Roseiflexus sp.]